MRRATSAAGMLMVTTPTRAYRLGWAAEDHEELIRRGLDAGTRRMARKEALLAQGRFLRACCAGPEGEVPEEHALVPEGAPCP